MTNRRYTRHTGCISIKYIISKTTSPPIIVEGKPKLDFKRNVIAFESYALAYTGTANNIILRAVPVIALRRSNNTGEHYFMSLYMHKRIHGYK